MRDENVRITLAKRTCASRHIGDVEITYNKRYSRNDKRAQRARRTNSVIEIHRFYSLTLLAAKQRSLPLSWTLIRSEYGRRKRVVGNQSVAFSLPASARYKIIVSDDRVIEPTLDGIIKITLRYWKSLLRKGLRFYIFNNACSLYDEHFSVVSHELSPPPPLSFSLRRRNLIYRAEWCILSSSVETTEISRRFSREKSTAAAKTASIDGHDRVKRKDSLMYIKYKII
jgi:hypothetical protein